MFKKIIVFFLFIISNNLVNSQTIKGNIKEIEHCPFYTSFIFLIIFSLVIIIILYIAFQYRLKIIKHQQEINKKLETYQYQALNKQMNPHFIFNSLNSIQNFILQNDIKNSNKYLTKFSKLMRMVLNNTQSHSISINSEIEALILYLELEQIRIKNSFEYEINIDEDVDTHTHKIPPLLLQPFVENAIWHGLMNMPSDFKGKININIKYKYDYLIFEIIDNGIGRSKAAEINKNKTNKSLGTKINKDRASLFNEIFNLSIKIKYIDLLDSNKKSKGTKVVIRVISNFNR